MLSRVKGRVAVISGASDEVATAIALQLSSAGATTILCAKDVNQLDAVAAKLKAAGGKAEAFAVDLYDPQAVEGFVKQIVAQHGRIDILVNNGPDPQKKALGELTVDDFNATVSMSLSSQFHFMREVVPIMQKNSGGRVVNISSLAYLGVPNNADAAAAKAGLFGLTRSTALEAARNGVTVNCVVKGDIASAATAAEEQTKTASGIPVKRIGSPADVAYAVGFFASDSADYVTGQTFFVCGGKSVYFSMSV